MTFKATPDNGENSSNNPTDNNGDHTAFLKVGDRVFETAEDAIKHIEHAQTHISTLENEAKFKDELILKLEDSSLSKDTVAKLLEKLDTSGKPNQTDEVSIDDLVNKAAHQVYTTLSEEQVASVEKTNLESAMAQAEKHYGETFKGVIATKAAELGMSIERVDALAKTSPNAFAALFITGNSTSGTPSHSTVNVNSDNVAAVTKTKSFMKMTSKEKLEYQKRLMESYS